MRTTQRFPDYKISVSFLFLFASIAIVQSVLSEEKQPSQADWPDFRGPQGNGLVSGAGDAKPIGLPLKWSETENVKWKTAIPNRGWSTPVVMGGQIWLTAATNDGHDFFAICVDAATGQICFNENVFHADKPEPLGNDVNCYASPSPVIEPGRVYIHFGSYGTACLDTATGKKIWERQDLPCRHYRGPGSSPVLFENLLILTFDGVDLQYVVALDKATGKNVWKTDRTAAWNDLDAKGKPQTEGDLRKAYSTPLIAQVNGAPQMFCAGAKAAYGYDPRTGRELWKIQHLGYSAALRPVFGQGLAFITSGFGKTELFAVRPDGQGDVTKTHIAWKTSKAVPRLSSPILVDDLFYMAADDGNLSCLDAKTGAEVWRQGIGMAVLASPIYADGRLYYFGKLGKTVIIKAGRAYELLATNTLESGLNASPAVTGKAFILRTKTHLYRIE
ncbi:MAG: PQQ-binding-like beta-propeller repeat protein [Candidatus Sumerlaeota bacterium]|nr:PQQ-binding-like beta-propeller repeat protein [Candidatus Sumerlaeota bacterium]